MYTIKTDVKVQRSVVCGNLWTNSKGVKLCGAVLVDGFGWIFSVNRLGMN